MMILDLVTSNALRLGEGGISRARWSGACPAGDLAFCYPAKTPRRLAADVAG